MSINLVSPLNWGVNRANVGCKPFTKFVMSDVTQAYGLIWSKLAKLLKAKLIDLQKILDIFMTVIQRLFLSQMYKIETLILQRVI